MVLGVLLQIGAKDLTVCSMCYNSPSSHCPDQSSLYHWDSQIVYADTLQKLSCCEALGYALDYISVKTPKDTKTKAELLEELKIKASLTFTRTTKFQDILYDLLNDLLNDLIDDLLDNLFNNSL